MLEQRAAEKERALQQEATRAARKGFEGAGLVMEGSSLCGACLFLFCRWAYSASILH